MAARSMASAMAWRTSSLLVGSWSPARSSTTQRVDGAWIASRVGTVLATWNDSAEENSASVIWPVRSPATIEDSSGIAWNTMASEQGLLRAPVLGVPLEREPPARIEARRARTGPVPTAVVSSALPSPPASFGMTPLYLPARLTRKVAAGAESTKRTVYLSTASIRLT